MRTETRGMDPADTLVYLYDDLYRLTTVQRGMTTIDGFGYDEVGNRTSYTPPGGPPETWTYETGNRLVDDTSYTYTYDDEGRLDLKLDGMGLVADYEWDLQDQLKSVYLPVDDRRVKFK